MRTPLAAEMMERPPGELKIHAITFNDVTRPILALGSFVCLVMLGLVLHGVHRPLAEPVIAHQASSGPPIVFIPNTGQAPHEAAYYAQGGGYGFAFGPRRATFASERGDRGHVLGLRFVGANPRPLIRARRRAAGRISYFTGAASARSLPTYREIVYRDLWPGIDMVFAGAPGRLEYSFVVHPGASVADIRLAYEGADGVSLTNAGDLVVRTSLGPVRDPRPRSRQRGRAVPSAFAPAGSSYGFTVGRYDHSRTLLIDPALVYGTFLGSAGVDEVSGIAVDRDGSAYITGRTYNGEFPTTPGAYKVTSAKPFVDTVFVSKLNPSGSDLVYSALIGGGSDFHAGSSGIAVDETGAAYVAGGTTQRDFPTTPGAFDRSFDEGSFSIFAFDGFVFKLSPDGSRLVYSTFLGGPSLDIPSDIAVDSQGRAHVTGVTGTGFPTTPGAFDTTASFNDAFITKLNQDGSGLVYSTFLGGSAGENGESAYPSIALDPTGNAYVAGTTSSTDFPTTEGAHDRTLNGLENAFLAKLNPAGNSLLAGTLFGGAGFDYVTGLALDPRGNAYVAGHSSSPDLPTTPGAYDRSYNGSRDAFVAKFTDPGFGLAWATYLGGAASDNFQVFGDIAVDRGGRAYVTGTTQSADFPFTSDAFSSASGSFLTKLRPDGSGLLFSTSLANAGPTGVGVDAHGRAYVGGTTVTDQIPTTSGAYDTSFNGDRDGFVMKVDTTRDTDGDGVSDDEDNCTATPNADQHDTDRDGVGDECDPTPGSTPCSVDAKGRLATNKQARLDLDSRDVRYHDVPARVMLRSAAVTSLIAYGDHATVRGSGAVDKQSVTFRVDLVAHPATIKIALSNGYSASGAFEGAIGISCP